MVSCKLFLPKRITSPIGALDGLFAMVAKEELNIRNNISARSSDLLRKVFAQQD